jgi:hypothetical protein
MTHLHPLGAPLIHREASLTAPTAASKLRTHVRERSTFGAGALRVEMINIGIIHTPTRKHARSVLIQTIIIRSHSTSKVSQSPFIIN